MRCRVAPSLFLAVAVALLASCGEPAAPRADVQPQWHAAKPSPLVGGLRAAVIERTGPDRALIEARWERRAVAEGCALEMVLPEGALLIEGARMRPLMAAESAGTERWHVQFPLGAPLDAVVRYCAEVDGALRACEVAVRLTD